MHRKRIRRIRFPQDPNPELEKHPMSLEASQSSRESTRYPRDIKPGPGGNPPGRGLESRGYRVDYVDLRGDFEASRLIGCLKSSGFGSEYSNHGARMRRIRFRCIEKSKNRTCSESNSERPKLTSKSAQNDPGTLIIGFALKNYAQKWSQIVKTLDG